jgi:D-tyrosyl-tRNA(Tyr) deacylase
VKIPAMRAVCQRVSRARVTVAGETVGAIGAGLVVLLGVARGDEAADAERMASKVARLRIFEDEAGRFAHSVLDVTGAALVVSQFTLIADYKRQGSTASPMLVPGWSGNRPSFTSAAPADVAEPLFEAFCAALAAEGIPVQTGVFGARMALELVNDGPVTVILDVAG